MEIKWLGEDRANLQLGYEVHECWDPILAKLHCIPTNTTNLTEISWKLFGLRKTEIFKSRNCLVVKVASNLLFTVKNPEEDYPQIVET